MNDTTAIVEAPSSELQTRDPESILRFAVQSGASVDVIERLMVVRTQLKAEAAKEAFDLAMSQFQAACPVIVKRKDGAKRAYKFAPLDAIVQEVRGLLTDHGFDYTFNSAVEGGYVKAVCRVTHCAGHSETSEFSAPVDSKNPMMSDPQKFGAAMTFAKRYAFCNAFGILTADEDTDGGSTRERYGSTAKQTVPVKPHASQDEVRETLLREIWSAAKDYFDGDKNAFMKWLIERRHIEPSDKLPNLSNEKLAQLANIAREAF